MNKRVSIVFRRGDEWLVECLTKLVDTKRLLGIDASFSYELVRLAKEGLVSIMDEKSDAPGAVFDRYILRGSHDSTPKSD